MSDPNSPFQPDQLREEENNPARRLDREDDYGYFAGQPIHRPKWECWRIEEPRQQAKCDICDEFTPVGTIAFSRIRNSPFVVCTSCFRDANIAEEEFLRNERSMYERAR